MIALGIVAAALVAAALGYVWVRFRELTRGVKTYKGRNVSRHQIDRYSVALNHYRAYLSGRHLELVALGARNSHAVGEALALNLDHSVPTKIYEEIGS